VGELTAVVLAGGLAYEREVSLHSGRRVCEALKQAGVAVRMLDPDGELLAGLAVDRPDAVFIALHGADGEDGALRSVLDLADVPYVGSHAAACRTWSSGPEPCLRAGEARAGCAEVAVWLTGGGSYVLTRLVSGWYAAASGEHGRSE